MASFESGPSFPEFRRLYLRYLAGVPLSSPEAQRLEELAPYRIASLRAGTARLTPIESKEELKELKMLPLALNYDTYLRLEDKLSRGQALTLSELDTLKRLAALRRRQLVVLKKRVATGPAASKELEWLRTQFPVLLREARIRASE